MGGGGVLARGAEKEVKKEKKKAGFGEYPPRERCDLYEPIKCECVGLTVVLCSVKGKCPFYKTGEQARKDMEWLLGCRVNLQLWVKIKEDWRNKPAVLHELGYE